MSEGGGWGAWKLLLGSPMGFRCSLDTCGWLPSNCQQITHSVRAGTGDNMKFKGRSRGELNAEDGCVGSRSQRSGIGVTLSREVRGTQSRFTAMESFRKNSVAMSPSPAPCSQSKTRSKLVRIWTARDHW